MNAMQITTKMERAIDALLTEFSGDVKLTLILRAGKEDDQVLINTNDTPDALFQIVKGWRREQSRAGGKQ